MYVRLTLHHNIQYERGNFCQMVSPFSVNWRRKASVIAYAKRLGAGNIVVKHKGRDNYNIARQSRRDLWCVPGCTVIYTVK